MSRIDDHIQRAIEQGAFDDLPGKGKPLNLDENPYEDPAWRLANRILKESGFSLPWIEMRQEIEADIEAARADLKQAWEWRQKGQGMPAPQREAEWERALEAFKQQVAKINQRIAGYNLVAPSEKFQRMKLNLAREIEAVTRVNDL